MSGHHLKKLRMANGLSQTYVAKELHIDRAKVSRWENDIILPSDEELKALSKLYSVDIKTLKSRLNKMDIETSLEDSESLIAEKLDELHLSVSNKLNAAIANQKESIRQQGEQTSNFENLLVYQDLFDIVRVFSSSEEYSDCNIDTIDERLK
ncbi:MAG: helix-turn-helix transcriptional regulator [Clostridiales bacterium]|nr:helix-turn-helix transcriptional regulator [Clostridiales bacterium]